MGRRAVPLPIKHARHMERQRRRRARKRVEAQVYAKTKIPKKPFFQIGRLPKSSIHVDQLPPSPPTCQDNRNACRETRSSRD